MCFKTKGSKIKIAKKDIECWKNVENYSTFCISEFTYFHYDYNQIYSGKSKLEIFLSWLFDEDVTNEAYHSYIKPIFSPKKYTNAKCIIPKGALYLINEEENEFCSSKIIIKGHLNMKVKELIDYVNSNGFYSLWNLENSLNYNNTKDLPQRVADNLEIDNHRWYEISTSVYKLEDGFVGIRGVSAIYSEYMDAEDCGFRCTASEYIEIPSFTYKKK